jgi:hypothetical protein
MGISRTPIYGNLNYSGQGAGIERAKSLANKNQFGALSIKPAQALVSLIVKKVVT